MIGVVSGIVGAIKGKKKDKRDLSDKLFSREPQDWAEFRP